MFDKKPIAWNGIEYTSISEAARANAVSQANMSRWINSGYSSDKDVIQGRGNSIVVTWNGIEYPSIAEAARANGITRAAMKKRIDAGYKSDDDLQKVNKTRIRICRNCKKPLQSGKKMYCSEKCKRSAQNKRNYRRNRKRRIKKAIQRRKQNQ